MAGTEWNVLPGDAAAFAHDDASLERHWARLHAGDREPWPDDPAVRRAWALCHAGEFRKALDAGLKAGGAGVNAANKAQAVHASHLEKDEKVRLAMLLEVVGRAQARIAQAPSDANGHYLLAHALGRYAQGVSVATALARGLGGQVRAALQTAIGLEPGHADAHVALGTFHAETIDKVGRLLAKTQGADAAMAIAMFRRALALNPASAAARIEYANGLVMLDGERRMAEAERLYAEAAACEPADAIEWLDVQRARAELEDD